MLKILQTNPNGSINPWFLYIESATLTLSPILSKGSINYFMMSYPEKEGKGKNCWKGVQEEVKLEAEKSPCCFPFCYSGFSELICRIKLKVVCFLGPRSKTQQMWNPIFLSMSNWFRLGSCESAWGFHHLLRQIRKGNINYKKCHMNSYLNRLRHISSSPLLIPFRLIWKSKVATKVRFWLGCWYTGRLTPEIFSWHMQWFGGECTVFSSLALLARSYSFS